MLGPGVQGDALKNVERIHRAAGENRRSGLDGIEGDPVDRRRAGGRERSGEIGGMESLDVTDLHRC